MCGIAGLVQFRKPIESARTVQSMADVIRHRGPDDVGYLFGNCATGACALFGGDDTPEAVFHTPTPYAPANRLTAQPFAQPYNLGIVNRRLAIVDLTPAGHQPMCNEDGTLWIVFNGEIYNCADLRTELEGRGHVFNSHADTEAILHAYEEWGPSCAGRFNGMWAFALWDQPRHRLLLSRDRVGIKPLYYSHTPERIVFGSEIKCLLAAGVGRAVNMDAVLTFLATGLTDYSPATFLQDVVCLPPAHNLLLDLDTGLADLTPYWALDFRRTLPYRSEAETVAAFREIFIDAVRVHLISDVPVGTCLSGGLDSSAVVGAINLLIRERGLHVTGMESRQKTFSARYTDTRHDEGRFIDLVVAEAGVEAFMVYPMPADLIAHWHELFNHLEEPSGSTSIFAQWNVFRLARQTGVTVTLDGQGGDELLAGYLGFFPFFLADLAAAGEWRRAQSELAAHVALHGVNRRHELRNLLINLIPAKFKNHLKRRQPLPDWIAPTLAHSGRLHVPYLPEVEGATRLVRSQLQELSISTLPSLLRFDDRNSMAHSIESRVPFLDYRLIEFCFALPSDLKIRNGVTKYILRSAGQYLLPEVVRRRHDKIGFSTPQDTWTRTEMADWMEDIFSTPAFAQRGFVHPAAVLNMLNAQRQGADFTAPLWRCLAVELWQQWLTGIHA